MRANDRLVEHYDNAFAPVLATDNKRAEDVAGCSKRGLIDDTPLANRALIYISLSVLKLANDLLVGETETQEKDEVEERHERVDRDLREKANGAKLLVKVLAAHLGARPEK